MLETCLSFVFADLEEEDSVDLENSGYAVQREEWEANF